MDWGSLGWLVIAALVTAAAVGLHPSVRLARRFLEQHVPADVLADATSSAQAAEPAPLGPPTVEQPAEPGGVSPLSS